MSFCPRGALAPSLATPMYHIVKHLTHCRPLQHVPPVQLTDS